MEGAERRIDDRARRRAIRVPRVRGRRVVVSARAVGTRRAGAAEQRRERVGRVASLGRSRVDDEVVEGRQRLEAGRVAARVGAPLLGRRRQTVLLAADRGPQVEGDDRREQVQDREVQDRDDRLPRVGKGGFTVTFQL